MCIDAGWLHWPQTISADSRAVLQGRGHPGECTARRWICRTDVRTIGDVAEQMPGGPPNRSMLKAEAMRVGAPARSRGSNVVSIEAAAVANWESSSPIMIMWPLCDGLYRTWIVTCPE